MPSARSTSCKSCCARRLCRLTHHHVFPKMRSPMTDSDRPPDFGSRMRRLREQRGVSLRDIAERTKISVTTLEALERNDIARMPGGIFSRAIVRAYAHE